jgi:hypothetical protein
MYSHYNTKSVKNQLIYLKKHKKYLTKRLKRSILYLSSEGGRDDKRYQIDAKSIEGK